MKEAVKQKIRRAVRVVIIDEQDKVAVIKANNGEYFKIPGGGVEAGESAEEVAGREALEEAGCRIEILEKIGEQEFFNKNPRWQRPGPAFGRLPGQEGRRLKEAELYGI